MSAEIAWGLAARLLADGAAPAVVALEAGGTAAQIIRPRRDDRGFRRWIEEARKDPKAAEPADAADRVMRHLAWQAYRGDPRALSWLARHRQTRPRVEEGPTLEEILAKLAPDELADFISLGGNGPLATDDAELDDAADLDVPGDDPAGDGDGNGDGDGDNEARAAPASGRDDGTFETPPPVPPRHVSRYPPPVPCPRWWEGD